MINLFFSSTQNTKTKMKRLTSKMRLVLALSVLCLYLIVHRRPTGDIVDIEDKTSVGGLEGKKDDVRIFCIVKTHPDNIRINKTQTVYDVWVRKCTNYRFISLIPDELRPNRLDNDTEDQVDVEISSPFYVLQPKYHRNEQHESLTLKVFNAFSFVYERFPDYDWYYLVDDDTYCNVNNMKLFLRDKDPQRMVTYGFDFGMYVTGGYHSGGPGYLISRKAFNQLGSTLKSDFNFCPVTGIDDIDVNDCLRRLGAVIETSTDHLGRHRFLCIDLLSFYLGVYPDWLQLYSLHQLRPGVDCCSDSLIAVHYMQPEDVIRLDVAIEIQENILRLYDRHIQLGRNVTFKDVFRNYVLLLDWEKGTNYFQFNLNKR